MVAINSIALLASAAVLAAAAPAPALVERATSCTFSAASAAIASKTACATIVLDNVVVPAGKTLDLTGLNTGTQASQAPHAPLP
jgi:polygalacturonase